MTPIDHYLKRLGFWIPASRRARITGEIHNAVLDRLDAATAAAGHGLSDAEAQAELRAFGSPVFIAGRYLEGAPVISSELAFFYWRVLKIVAASIVAAQLVVLVALHDWDDVGLAITQAGGRTALALLIGFASVTGSFLMIDRWRGSHMAV